MFQVTNDGARFHSRTVKTAPASRVLRALRLGTCLSGAAASLMVVAPSSALAAERVLTDGLGVSLPRNKIGRNAVSRPQTVLPEDLTVLPARARSVPTSAPNDTGITMSGSGALSISRAGALADVDTQVGDVTTYGDFEHGVFADTNFPGDPSTINITAGNVTTHGYAADGIHAESYTGNITIDAGAVHTHGENSAGVFATSAGGDIGINVEGVVTYGTGAGVHAFTTSGDISVNVADEAASYGDFAPAIEAQTLDGNIVINSAGIAIAGGWGSSAISAESGNGDVTVVAYGAVSLGHFSDVINVQAEGTANVTVNYIYAGGHYSDGIEANGNAVNVVLDDSIVVFGYYSNAIEAIGGTGGVNVTNNGQISVNNFGGNGIVAIAYGNNVSGGNVTIDSETVNTNADATQAIAGIAIGGDVTINSETIHATGLQNAGGIYAAVHATDDPYDSTGHDINITAGTVTTVGNGQSAAITAVNLTYGGDINIDVTGPITTRRDEASGVIAYSQTGDVVVNVDDVSTRGNIYAGAVWASGASAAIHATGDISTMGDRSAGLHAYGATWGQTIINDGSVTTLGMQSHGLYAVGRGGATIVNNGSIETSGQFSHGIYVFGQWPEVEDPWISILNNGSISTHGDNTTGIRALTQVGGITIVSSGTIETSGDYGHGIIASIQRAYYGPNVAHTLSIDANSVVVSGAGSIGITGFNASGGDVIINSDTVTATGVGSIGISTNSIGQLVVINAGDVTADEGIVGRGSYDVEVNVTGAVKAAASDRQGHGITVFSALGDGTVNIAAGASVVGSGHRDETYRAYGNGILINSWDGTATVNNAGSVSTNGDGYAIEFVSFEYSPQALGVINNSGTITGAVRVTEQNDVFTNSGSFNVTKNSHFGTGDDLFTNSGTVNLIAATATNVTFDGLERFDNTGGLVDLRNGHVGDVLTLTGNFVGSGDARLALDVKGTAADNLVVQGAATGKTNVLLTNLDASGATLTGAAPITLIKVGAGSAADAFSLATTNVGFIQYGLAYDAEDRFFNLVGTAGSGVYRGLKIGEGAASAWNQSADVWTSHMAELRDGGGSPERRLWGQLYGQVDKRDEDRDVAVSGGTAQRYDLGYKQDHRGAQLGFDLGNGGVVTWGVTGGYLSSKLKFEGADEKVKYGVFNVGLYGSYRSGSFFANGLVKYDNYSIEAKSEELGYSDKFKASGYGARLEAGARFDMGGLYVEPVASLAWQTTKIDDPKALGQSLDFDSQTGLRGKVGARIGGRHDLGSGSALVFYGGANLVHEFQGEDGVTLFSGGTSEHVDNERIKSYGQGLLGLNFVSTGKVSGFAEGNANFGNSYKGGGGRVGLRVKF